MTAAHEDAGPIADEAGRLVQGFVHWARETATRMDLGSFDHVATGSADCMLCPICQAIGMVRGDPAATERITALATQAATAVAGALRAVFDGHSHEREPEVVPIDLDADESDVPDEGDE